MLDTMLNESEMTSPDEYEQALCDANGIEILKAASQFRVKSSSGTGSYVVRYNRGWVCDCPARKTCKHIALVAEISDAVRAEFQID